MTIATAAKIAIVLKGYPRLSETFIAQEVLGLERRGLPLHLVSLRHPTDPARHPVHDEITAPLLYLPEYLHHEPRRAFRAWRSAAKLPGYAAARAAAAADYRRDPTRNRMRRFGQACVLAAELGGTATHLHAHFLHTPGSVARYAAMLLGIGFSLSGHAKDVWTTPRWDLADKLCGAAWTVACSNAAADTLRDIAPGASIETVYHGLDPQRFPSYTEMRPPRTGAAQDDPLRLLAVGRAVDKKGFDGLLSSLAALPSVLHWRLTHIGAGPRLSELQRQAGRLGLSDRIDWQGARTQDHVLHSMRAADLFLMTSRITADGDRDGLPNVLMEAQSQALPVIATQVSAIPELVQHGRTGVLVPPEDADALCAAIQGLAGDPGRRTHLGAAGAARLRKEFGSDAGLDRLADRLRNNAVMPRPANARAA